MEKFTKILEKNSNITGHETRLKLITHDINIKQDDTTQNWNINPKNYANNYTLYSELDELKNDRLMQVRIV
jgi:hypothetical protein